MKNKIIVIGGGGHAKVVISLLKKINKFTIVGFTDNEKKENILGIDYLGDDNILKEIYENGIENCAIGIGQIKSALIRKTIVKKLAKTGFIFPSIISPTVIINEDVKIGEGTVIMDGVVINSGTKIGNFSILNTNSSIDHDCVIGNYVHIAPGATLSGEVNIGDNVLVGTGSSIIQNRRIVSNCIIAAGSSVQKSLDEEGTYRGVPARLIRKI